MLLLSTADFKCTQMPDSSYQQQDCQCFWCEAGVLYLIVSVPDDHLKAITFPLQCQLW